MFSALMRNRKLFLLVGFIAFALAATAACILLMPLLTQQACDDLESLSNGNQIQLNGFHNSRLRIALNTKETVKKTTKYYHCSETKDYLSDHSGNVSCKKYEWRPPQFVKSVTDCFDLSEQHWFGGSIMWDQQWPINSLVHAEAPYVPGDVYRDQYGGVIERFWISSGGFSIFVEDDVPLLVEFRDNKMCLAGSLDSQLPYNLTARSEDSPLLAYTICKAPSIRQLYTGIRLWELPKSAPDRDLFTRPIWSTWAFLKQNISESSVLAFAQNISNSNLSCSQVEIDDKWSTNYGDHVFDSSRFLNPSKLVKDIHDLGYNVTIWMHPFVNSDTEAFKNATVGMRAGQVHLLTNASDSSQPAYTEWWRGENSTLIDVTDPQSRGAEDFRQKLRSLLEIGVDSFKFDGGETNWIPAGTRFAVSKVNPGWYTEAWSQLAYKSDTEIRRQETRIGFRAQQLPILVRTMDKDSHWGLDNGLKAIVTSALTHCLIGYNYYLPDMIGGNAYCNDTGLEGLCYPNEELYIRWLQLAVFMPSVQFSVPPWIFRPEVTELTRELLMLRHEEKFQKNMDRALEEAKNGVPIVRPIWWVSNSNFDINDQFLLGDRILVAPILNPSQTSRRVHFPAGKWRQWFAEDSSNDVTGPETMENYTIPLLKVSSIGAFYLID